MQAHRLENKRAAIYFVSATGSWPTWTAHTVRIQSPEHMTNTRIVSIDCSDVIALVRTITARGAQ